MAKHSYQRDPNAVNSPWLDRIQRDREARLEALTLEAHDAVQKRKAVADTLAEKLANIDWSK